MIKIQSNLWLRNQQLWVLILACLFLADFITCGYWPSHSRLKALQERESRYEQTIQIARAEGSQVQALQRRLSDTDQIVAHYDARVPAESSLGTFFSQVADLMTRHQLAGQAVVADDAIQAGELTYIPVHVTGMGKLGQIFGFFNDLRGLDRLVRVDKVTLKNDKDFAGRVTMETEVVIYYRTPRAQGGGVVNGGGAGGGSTHGV